MLNPQYSMLFTFTCQRKMSKSTHIYLSLKKLHRHFLASFLHIATELARTFKKVRDLRFWKIHWVFNIAWFPQIDKDDIIDGESVSDDIFAACQRSLRKRAAEEKNIPRPSRN